METKPQTPRAEALGDKLESSQKSTGRECREPIGDTSQSKCEIRPKHSDHPVCTGRQVGKWETSLKSCRLSQYIVGVLWPRLSPTCLPAVLWILCTYLPLVPIVPLVRNCRLVDFALASHFSPRHSGFFARVIAGLSPTCLPVHSGCSERSGPHDFALSPTTLWIVCSHDVRLVSPLTCLPVHSGRSECFGPHDCGLVFSSCLPPHSGFSARVMSGLSPTFSSTVWVLVCVISHLFTTCLPVVLASHLLLHWVFCQHDLHCSPACSTCLHLSPMQCMDALSALVRMI